VLGVIGRALSLYEVKLHAFAVMSNHVHLLMSPRDAEQLAAAMRHISRNISDEVGRLHGWSGPMWSRRYRAIVVADEASQVARLRYVLAHGCKEGLVARPAEWPGASCVEALVDGVALRGQWRDRSAEYEARRSGSEYDPEAYEAWYPVPLAPLPCWRGLSAEEHQRRCAELVADIERETAAVNRERGREPMGAAGVLAQHPHAGPRSSHHSPAPLVHAATRAARRAFAAAYRAFVDAFRAAADKLRAGVRDVAFPLGAFPPPRPFVSGASASGVSPPSPAAVT
jgi:hypothetical protein